MSEAERFQIDKRQLRRAFERAAHTYDASAVLQHEVGRRMQERLALIRLRPRSILDVGAGTGQGSQALLHRYRGARLIALDIALPMLGRVRARCGRLRRPALVCADAEALPIADRRMDLVYSNLTLQWCNDTERTLREFQRVLAAGGLLLFTTLGPDTLSELRQSWAGADTLPHVNRFLDMHDIGDALLRSGFSDPVIDRENLILTYPDTRRLMQDLKQIGAQNKIQGRRRGLTGKRRLDRFRQAYEAHRLPDGLLPASYEVLFGHAWAPQTRSPTGGTSRPREIRIPVERIRQR
jgi:malonyl-CoA O-methyltransferase